MKRILIVFLALALFVPAAYAADEGVVARVNGREISQAEYDRNVKAFLSQRGMPAGHTAQGKGFEGVNQEVLDLVITNELLWQDAEKQKLAPEAAALDAEMEKVRGGYPSPEVFKKALEGAGLDEGALRDLIGRRMAIQRLVEEKVASGVSVTDEDAKAYYDGNVDQFKTSEEIKARHILVTVEESADETTRAKARAKIDDLLKQVKAGGDFAELAGKNSDCPSGKKGGDLGFFGRGRMVKPFEDAAFALKPGQVSDVVETQFGYHIIKLDEHKDAGMMPFDEIGPRIKDFLKSQKVGKAVDDYSTALRAKADVKVLLSTP